jgi:hypothetical protein
LSLLIGPAKKASFFGRFLTQLTKNGLKCLFLVSKAALKAANLLYIKYINQLKESQGNFFKGSNSNFGFKPLQGLGDHD